MEKGISIYFGLDNTLEENLQLLHRAAQRGITRLFTSLHIPEADYRRIKAELPALLKESAALHMDIISDISPNTKTLMNLDSLDPAAFAALGITTLRMDYGYTAEQIALLTRGSAAVRLQLNASTITADFLAALDQSGADFTKIDALHNFYPRRGTGISERFLRQKNSLLQARGITVGAFVPSAQRRRSPLKEGLPTLETHRSVSAGLAARHLAAVGIDAVFIGDSFPSIEELDALAAIEKKRVDLKIRPFTADPAILKLLRQTFTARADEARDVIRAQESRSFFNDCHRPVQPENTIGRRRSCVTLDNKNYGRYMGELQIIKRSQPADPRVNVIAAIDEQENFLLTHLRPGQKFSFLW